MSIRQIAAILFERELLRHNMRSIFSVDDVSVSAIHWEGDRGLARMPKERKYNNSCQFAHIWKTSIVTPILANIVNGASELLGLDSSKVRFALEELEVFPIAFSRVSLNPLRAYSKLRRRI